MRSKYFKVFLEAPFLKSFFKSHFEDPFLKISLIKTSCFLIVHLVLQSLKELLENLIFSNFLFSRTFKGWHCLYECGARFTFHFIIFYHFLFTKKAMGTIIVTFIFLGHFMTLFKIIIRIYGILEIIKNIFGNFCNCKFYFIWNSEKS